MRIDSHQHFWKYNSNDHSWIADDMSVLRHDFPPLELETLLKEFRFDGCVAVEANPSEKETEFLLQCALENTFIKGVVGWVDLRSDNVSERLSHFAKNNHLKGVRHLVQAEPDGFMLDKAFQNGISKLGQFGLTYDILIFPHQIQEAAQLVASFPNQKFVLDHIAKPFIKSKKIERWQRDMEMLSQYKNVHCKVSGMVTEADWNAFTHADFIPYLDVVFSCFGTDRIMFGSDWPVCNLAGSYGRVLEIVETYSSRFSKEEQQKIMGGNAVAFYDLAL